MADELLWHGGALIAIGGVLLLIWALFGDRARGRRRCPRCWYNMTGATGRRCPECGNEAVSDKHLLRTRRHWRWAFASAPVFAIAGFVYIQPEVKRHGWGRFVPNTVYVMALDSNDPVWAFAELEKRETSKFYQWQWRQIANSSMKFAASHPLPTNKIMMLPWMNTSLVYLEDDDLAWSVYLSMTQMLSEQDLKVREAAAIYCGEGRFPQEAVKQLEPLLNDPNGRIRGAAVTGLRLLSHNSHLAIQPLCAALEHDDWMVRMFAAAALGSAARYGDTAVPEYVFDLLVKAFESDPRVDVQARALGALFQFPSRRDQAIVLLRKALASDEPPLRAAGLDVLSTIESFNVPLEQEYGIKGLLDSSSMVRISASWLVRHRIPTERLFEHEDYLRDLVNDPNESEYVRNAAIFHLTEMEKFRR